MLITGLRCTGCGAADLIACWPGNTGQRQLELFWLVPDRPARGWCQECWLKRYGCQPATPSTMESSGNQQPLDQ